MRRTKDLVCDGCRRDEAKRRSGCEHLRGVALVRGEEREQFDGWRLVRLLSYVVRLDGEDVGYVWQVMVTTHRYSDGLITRTFRHTEWCWSGAKKDIHTHRTHRTDTRSDGVLRLVDAIRSRLTPAS